MLPVYCDHFRLTESFSITPDPSFLYRAKAIRRRLRSSPESSHQRLRRLDRRGGTGKTTSIHSLLEELNDNTKTADLQPGRNEVSCGMSAKIGLVSDQESGGTLTIIFPCLSDFSLRLTAKQQRCPDHR
jgi:hypothetical protein